MQTHGHNDLLLQPSKASEQSQISNFTHKVWVNLWSGFRHFSTVLHTGIVFPVQYYQEVTSLADYPPSYAIALNQIH